MNRAGACSAVLSLMVACLGVARAQPPDGDEAPPTKADAVEDEEPLRPDVWGFFDAGQGFQVAKTDLGELWISGYLLLRYLNQLPEEDTFVDHLGRERSVDGRQDIQFHRSMIHFRGWLFDPRFELRITGWTVLSSQNVNIIGYAGYRFHRAFNLFGGVDANPGTRTMTGNFPLWLGTDRVMADEFARPGFTAGVWATGEPIDGLFYKLMVGNNISLINLTGGQLDRRFSYGASVWWMPTTGEFGPRGGFGDWDYHERLATRFGVSGVYTREERYTDLSTPAPGSTQIRLADGVLAFETGALAPDVTLLEADFAIVSADVGFKYKGIYLGAEYHNRWLFDFATTGPVPVDSIVDRSFYVKAAFFPIRRRLELYTATSWVFGDRDAGFETSREYIGGANYYPFDTPGIRLNLHFIDVEDSPTGSLFGYYQPGMDGQIVSVAASIFF